MDIPVVSGVRLITKEEIAKLALKATDVAVAICEWDHIDIDAVTIDIDGEVAVQFTRESYCDTEYKSVYLTQDELEGPIEKTVEDRKQAYREKLAKEKALEQIVKKQRAAAQEIAKEKADRELYEKLKVKFKNK